MNRGGDRNTSSRTVLASTPTEGLPTVCVLAGGLGSRLGERVASTPKPLLEVAGEPFLFHLLRLLAQNGAREVVLCVGYRGEQIEGAVGDRRFGIDVRYSYDRPDLDGTLGAIRRAARLLPDRFLVTYGDAYLRLDYAAAVDGWIRSGLPGMMTIFENGGRWGQSNAILEDGRVVDYDKHHPTSGMRWIDYGVGGLTQDALRLVEPDEPDLSRLQTQLARTNQLFGFEVAQRFYEIGTPAALAEAEAFLRSLVT
jgi:NDP-sugar pyrophosphorylase family protein